jgi:hypothetical protein
MGIELEIKLIAKVKPDNISLEDAIQSPVFPGARKRAERAGIDPFDKEPPSSAVAQEQAAGFSAGTLERLRPEVLPGRFGQINIHLFNYSRMQILW